MNDITANAAQAGNVDIKVKSSTGNTYTSVYTEQRYEPVLASYSLRM